MRLWQVVWRYTIAGLLVWVPLIITLWLAWIVVNNIVLGIEGLIQAAVVQLNIIGPRLGPFSFLQHVPYYFGFGVLLVFLVFLGTGFLTRYLIGRKFIEYSERLLQAIPLLSRVYRSVQQIRDVFIGRQGAVFQSVCLIEYPRKGLITVGFVTATERGLVQEATHQELVAVFVPTTPNPTSGYLVYVQPNEITPIDISVEEAMKLIVSGGAYLPVPGEESPEDEDNVREELRRALGGPKTS